MAMVVQLVGDHLVALATGGLVVATAFSVVVLKRLRILAILRMLRSHKAGRSPQQLGQRFVTSSSGIVQV
jgi:hypothetical protein